jgi:hypothetical protein
MTENVSTRDIEPFSFFWQHASAIPGLGGTDRSPDPNYCFHTPYHEYRPGIVMFRATIIGAKACYGELAMRVHAFRPDSGFDASLVAGSRTPLNDLDGSNLEIAVRVTAVPGVLYALYGYFSEPSDLEAAGLSIVAEELGGDSPEDYISSDAARSLFEAASVDMPNRLMADNPPRFAHPVSQPLTIGQLESAEYLRSWSQIPVVPSDQPSRWRQAYALQALEGYGILREGATGLLIAPERLPISAALQGRGCLVTDIVMGSSPRSEARADASARAESVMAAADIETIRGRFDFLVAISSTEWFADKAGFFGFASAALRQVLRGGIAIILFDYATDVTRRSELPIPPGGFHPHRGEIEQLAMRIISHGSDVAQLSFADGIGNNRAISPTCPFGLIVRR